MKLLEYLAATPYEACTRWRQWEIERIGGGANNVLYHVRANDANLAVKFTIRDARDRAGREYGTLAALQQAGLAIAPQPLLLQRKRYPQPVVVQTWLEGTALSAPPTTDEEWDALIDHLGTIHSCTPETIVARLPPVVLTMRSAAEGRARIQENVLRIPPGDCPNSLRELLACLDRTVFPTWSPAQLCLCRGDCNSRNFLRRQSSWASVDWEYSGWGDPAFEVADLLAAPSFLSVTSERRNWVIGAYSASSVDPTIATRIHSYVRLMLVWWATRFARSGYEVPLGFDQRLATRSATWQEENEAKYEEYRQRAEDALATQNARATAAPGGRPR